MLGLPGALNVDGLQPSPPSFPRTWLPQSLGQAQENRGQHFPHCLRPPSGEQAGLAAFPSPPAFTQAPSCHFWFCKHWSLFLSWPGPLALLPSLAKFLVILQVFVLDVSSSRKPSLTTAFHPHPYTLSSEEPGAPHIHNSLRNRPVVKGFTFVWNFPAPLPSHVTFPNLFTQV